MLQDIINLFPHGTIFTLDPEVGYHTLVRELKAHQFLPTEPRQDADQILIQLFIGKDNRVVEVAHDESEVRVVYYRKEG